jgi:hypothetical protein
MLNPSLLETTLSVYQYTESTGSHMEDCGRINLVMHTGLMSESPRVQSATQASLTDTDSEGRRNLQEGYPQCQSPGGNPGKSKVHLLVINPQVFTG